MYRVRICMTGYWINASTGQPATAKTMTPDCYRLSARYAASGQQTAIVAWLRTSIVRWRNITGELTPNVFIGSCRRITCYWQNLAIKSQNAAIPAASWHLSRIRAGAQMASKCITWLLSSRFFEEDKLYAFRCWWCLESIRVFLYRSTLCLWYILRWTL